MPVGDAILTVSLCQTLHVHISATVERFTSISFVFWCAPNECHCLTIWNATILYRHQDEGTKGGWMDRWVGVYWLCMNHKCVCVCVRSTWAYETGVRKETWYTTDSQIVCFTHPWHSRNFFFLCFKICSKWTVTVFSAWLDVSFVLVGAALFSTSWKANVVRLMLARKQNKGRWDGV